MKGEGSSQGGWVHSGAHGAVQVAGSTAGLTEQTRGVAQEAGSTAGLTGQARGAVHEARSTAGLTEQAREVGPEGQEEGPESRAGTKI